MKLDLFIEILKLFTLSLYLLFIIQLHDQFDSIKATYKAIQQYVLNNRESFKGGKLNQKQFTINCKECSYRFSI
jgi:hypothetical protein